MESSGKLKRKFFGSEELATSLPGEVLDSRIARALRYMASQATWDQDEIIRSVDASANFLARRRRKRWITWLPEA